MISSPKHIEVWCTLGPSSLDGRIIRRMAEAGADMFRINLSHTKIKDIESVIFEVKKHTLVPVCLDTEGPQIRTGVIKNGRVFLEEHGSVILSRREIEGNAKSFNIRPLNILSELEIGDLISVDFDSVLLSVLKLNGEFVETKVICGGWVGSNKAVTLDRQVDMPILSDKDLKGIEILNKCGLNDVSLSFVRDKKDVEFVRNLVGSNVRIISKVETNSALINLEEIIDASDGILIDRGDLSREEPINKIPLLQKSIIDMANKKRKSVYVATNLLESMVKTKKPLRSEVNDVVNTLLDGADGLVLAAETAIGDYPSECVNMMSRLIKYFRIAKHGYNFSDLLKKDSFLLIEPHGGSLVEKHVAQPDHKSVDELPKLNVDECAIIDVEQICIGTYSPLQGFMCKADLFEVLDNYQLPSGVVWPLPIVLQISERECKRFKRGDDVALTYEKDGLVYALMHIEDIYSVDLEEVSQKYFGTTNIKHPGVKRLFEKGNCFFGGEVELVRRRASNHREYEFTPRQMRIIFEHKLWSKVAGFHTRNAIHRVHEFLQMSALKKYDLDGLFIHPVVGPKKLHDFKSSVILETYQMMLDKYYPKDKVMLGAFSAYSHYAGPREAVFTALCRKNYGCNYFIVGRDHTGVGDFYNSDASQKLFEKLGDIGITPIFYDTVYYCSKCKGYVESCGHEKENYFNISGSEARKKLMAGEQLPDWFLREEISNLIRNKIQNKMEVFVE